MTYSFTNSKQQEWHYAPVSGRWVCPALDIYDRGNPYCYTADDYRQVADILTYAAVQNLKAQVISTISSTGMVTTHYIPNPVLPGYTVIVDGSGRTNFTLDDHLRALLNTPEGTQRIDLSYAVVKQLYANIPDDYK